MVQLLGPSLLPHLEQQKAEMKPGEDKTEKNPTDPEKAMTGTGKEDAGGFENVLVQFTLALYRAVVNELAQAYRVRMVRLASPQWERRPSDLERTAACLEAPGELALELDEYPGKARLREFWRRARALPAGLLPRREVSTDMSAVSDQGVRELVALCSVSEAYRRISGTIQAKKEDTAAAKDSITRSIEAEAKGKDFFGPLITLLLGGAVATGVAALKPKQIALPAIAGVLTALGSAVIAKFSTVRSHERSALHQDLFLPNLSVTTLDRVLPVLLDRVRDAGLAPVFIIDELDKVEDLSERIPQMVRRLKKLVAERAFFCFLTDRRYFEEMCSRTSVTAYSLEYSYFSHKLFVTFSHTDFHSYLDELFKSTSPEPAGTTSEASALLDEETADRAVLPYILLHAAQMHPIDLRRQLSDIRGADGAVTIPSGEVRSNPGRLLQLSMQVAIELLLETNEMQLELAREPAFRRLAHDALYFISRKWELEEDKLVFDAEAKEKFRGYLIDRMNTETPSKNSQPNGAQESENASLPQAPAPTATPSRRKGRVAVTSKQSVIGPALHPASSQDDEQDLLERVFTKQQADFLWKQVRQLADWLAGPVAEIRKLALAKPTHRFAPQVLDALKFSDPGPLLHRVQNGEQVTFYFSYSRAGRPNAEVAAQAATVAEKGQKKVPVVKRDAALRATKLDVDFINSFDRAVRDLTRETVTLGTLGARFGVISTSPAWPSVESALKRLEALDDEYPEKDDDISIVGQFASLLKRSAYTIGLGIFCGWLLGAWSERKNGERELNGLQVLSQALELKALHEEEVQTRIKKFYEQLCKYVNVAPKPSGPVPVNTSEVRHWREFVEQLIKEAEPFVEAKL
jgi:hypothetical protein